MEQSRENPAQPEELTRTVEGALGALSVHEAQTNGDNGNGRTRQEDGQIPASARRQSGRHERVVRFARDYIVKFDQ